MADEVCAINDGLEEDQAPRRQRYLLNLQRYEGRKLAEFNAAAYDTAEAGTLDGEQRLPLYRSLCDTQQADIAGRQRPRPMFLSSGADWRTRRRAKKVDRVVEGVLHQPHGDYVNGWELATDAELAMSIMGACGVKVLMDRITEECRLERVLPGRVKVDPRECEGGMKPKNWFDSYLMDEDQALEEFVELPLEEGLIDEARAEELREAIGSAAVTDDALRSEYYSSTRIARSVKIREAWRAPIGKKKPGKHVFCVPGKVLWSEDWHRDGPGIVWMRWSREQLGYWAFGLIDEAEPMVREANKAAQHLDERMKLLANRRTFLHELSEINPADMEANEIENLIRYSGQAAPVVQDLPPFHPAELDYKRDNVRDSFDLVGIPQGTATARKEQGVTAGVAIRMVRDIGAQRQAVRARNFENFFVALAKEIVACIAEWTEATGKDYTARVPGKASVTEIKWSEAQLDLDSVFVKVAPVSSLPNDPAGKMSAVRELFQDGILSPKGYMRLIDMPDLEKELSMQSAEADYLDDLIDKFLDAEPDQDPKTYWQNPDGFIIDKPAALAQFAAAYFTARREGAPEFNLELLRRYMMRLDKLIQRAAEAAAQASGAAAPGQPPMAPGVAPPPGMPPGLPIPPAAGAAAPLLPPGIAA